LCIHTATVYGTDKPIIKDIINANLFMPLELLVNSIEYGCPIFINTDSFYTLFNKQYQYLNEYSTAKSQFKEWGDFYDSKKDIKFINARLFHLYGQNDKPTKFVNSIIKSLKNNLTTIDLTSGAQKRDFIYIDDAIEAFLLIILNLNKINQRQIDIGTGNSISIRNFVELVHNLTGSSSILNFGILPTRKGEIMNITANNNIISELGWKQKYTLTEGLNTLINQI